MLAGVHFISHPGQHFILERVAVCTMVCILCIDWRLRMARCHGSNSAQLGQQVGLEFYADTYTTWDGSLYMI